MDDLIKKIRREVKDKKNISADKDLKVLLKKDKVQDKKVEKYEKMKKNK